ncbi:MAG: hypothetical protein ACFE91_13625 [Promethearchaeota archaeon]
MSSKIENNKVIISKNNNRKRGSISREGFFNKYPCSFCFFIFGTFGYTIAFITSELSTSYITIFSISLGVYSAVSFLIFLAEYKWYKKDMSKTITKEEFGEIQITESLRGGRNSLIIMVLVIIGFWMYISLALIITSMLIAVIIIWVINGPFILFIYFKFLKGVSDLREFIINDKFIQFIVPPKPIFHVNWMQIDRIELTLKPYLKYPGRPRRYMYAYNLKFIGTNFDQNFLILRGREFGRKFTEIIDLLEKFATKLNKEFIKEKED